MMPYAFRIVFCICLVAAFATGCTQKDEVLVHDTLYVPGNKPKDYSGVPRELVENYVNKIYIDLIGLKPSASELSDDVDNLINHGLSPQSSSNEIDYQN